MKKKKILIVFGTRPEAIKMAPVVAAVTACKDLQARVCVSAQHRQMLDDVLAVFKIKPQHDLNIMQDGQSLFHVTAEVLTRMQGVLEKEKPDLALVHGDTTTAFAVSLAAFYMKIPVGHVEAGLRSGDMLQPFPEEANRVLVDRLCALYFAPTETAQKALLKEGVSANSITVTGNTVIDALKYTVSHRSAIPSSFTNSFKDKIGITDTVTKLVLVTAHRRENFGKPFERIFTALRRTALENPGVQFVYPVHPNPNVQLSARRLLSGLENFHLIAPVNYPDMAALMQKAHLVVTDSGGIQEEAPSLGKPVLVLRNVTERPEALKAGTVKLVGSDEKLIQSSINRLLKDKLFYERMSRAHNPYGDGKAAVRTIEAIRFYFGLTKVRPAGFKL
jgi:UDP-N-acetylglucosamine 2-epimerase (non-hydrolysing)